MTKQGVVQTGKTPSAASGRPSEMIKKGEAVCRGEKTPKGPEALKGRIPLSASETGSK